MESCLKMQLLFFYREFITVGSQLPGPQEYSYSLFRDIMISCSRNITNELLRFVAGIPVVRVPLNDFS